MRACIAIVSHGTDPDPLISDTPHSGAILNDIAHVTPDEVEAILASLSEKSSLLDFEPTSVLKSACRVFSHIIVRPANLSVSNGTFPAKFKMADITPSSEKIGLDDSDFENYCSISNLNTIS